MLTAAAFAVLVAASQSGGDIQATDANADSLQALFLAETGVERALKRFATGTACGAGLAGNDHRPEHHRHGRDGLLDYAGQRGD